ncbi:hypothetical protein PJ311_15040 [Bacillus sp. CLL-7-23]|uniref:Uncharacterized protein n=1 Tax=Bacillus changyiensis TaxID=3004103 RepID=A0ABT4X6G9_9BACI|nr:hypothetical protein [Bacillus changyiensis]MDA7027890.1 hypothetical protein [Bacillus changyiensis]
MLQGDGEGPREGVGTSTTFGENLYMIHCFQLLKNIIYVKHHHLIFRNVVPDHNLNEW